MFHFLSPLEIRQVTQGKWYAMVKVIGMEVSNSTIQNERWVFVDISLSFETIGYFKLFSRGFFFQQILQYVS